MVELQNMYDEFEAADAAVIAISQEDTSLDDHIKMLTAFQPEPRFDVVADLNRRRAKAYDRTTAYLIDKQGIVRQIFPMVINARPSWQIILGELQKLEGVAQRSPER